MTRAPNVLDALNQIYDADLTFDELSELIDQADGIAVRFVKDLGALVGRPLGTLLTAPLDPDCVVIDAGLGPAVGPFIEGLSVELARRCPPVLFSGLAIAPGSLVDVCACAIVAASAAARVVSRPRPIGSCMPRKRRNRPTGRPRASRPRSAARPPGR